MQLDPQRWDYEQHLLTTKVQCTPPGLVPLKQAITQLGLSLSSHNRSGTFQYRLLFNICLSLTRSVIIFSFRQQLTLQHKDHLEYFLFIIYTKCSCPHFQWHHKLHASTDLVARKTENRIWVWRARPNPSRVKPLKVFSFPASNHFATRLPTMVFALSFHLF